MANETNETNKTNKANVVFISVILLAIFDSFVPLALFVPFALQFSLLKKKERVEITLNSQL